MRYPGEDGYRGGCVAHRDARAANDPGPGRTPDGRRERPLRQGCPDTPGQRAGRAGTRLDRRSVSRARDIVPPLSTRVSRRLGGGGPERGCRGRYRRLSFHRGHPAPDGVRRRKVPGDLDAEEGDWRMRVDRTNSDGAGSTAPVGDAAAVRETVEAYLHGLKFNDVESLRRAFWPDARLFFVDKDGHLGQLTQARWYEGFAPVAGREEEGELRIASLTATRDIASVTVVEEYPRSRYTDYLSLVKFDSGWRIVNKIYTSEPRTP